MTDDHDLDESAAGDGFADHRDRLRARHFWHGDELTDYEAGEGRWSDARCRQFLKAWLAVNEPGGMP